jgi:hypothetical protein
MNTDKGKRRRSIRAHRSHFTSVLIGGSPLSVISGGGGGRYRAGGLSVALPAAKTRFPVRRHSSVVRKLQAVPAPLPSRPARAEGSRRCRLPLQWLARLYSARPVDPGVEAALREAAPVLIPNRDPFLSDPPALRARVRARMLPPRFPVPGPIRRSVPVLLLAAAAPCRAHPPAPQKVAWPCPHVRVLVRDAPARSAGHGRSSWSRPARTVSLLVWILLQEPFCPQVARIEFKCNGNYRQIQWTACHDFSRFLR